MRWLMFGVGSVKLVCAVLGVCGCGGSVDLERGGGCTVLVVVVRKQ